MMMMMMMMARRMTMRIRINKKVRTVVIRIGKNR
jgi:hypothetical protein